MPTYTVTEYGKEIVDPPYRRSVVELGTPLQLLDRTRFAFFMAEVNATVRFSMTGDVATAKDRKTDARYRQGCLVRPATQICLTAR